MNHVMHLNPEPFDQIKSHIKTIEARLYDAKRRAIAVGDDILFLHRDTEEELLCEVIGLSIFASFTDMFHELSPKLFGFTDGETPEQAAAAMRTYYTPEEEQMYGVVGISVAPLA